MVVDRAARPLLRHILDTPCYTREAPLSHKSLRGFILSSGASRARTGDPRLAKAVLSQLSYGPWAVKVVTAPDGR